MKSKGLIPLAVGLAVGIFAIKLTFDFVSKARASAGPAEGVPVLRAVVEVPMAAEITADMVDVVQSPKHLVPKGAFETKESLIGRVTAVRIPPGMPVLPSMLAPEGTKAGMESRIPEGYRAVAVKIDESSGVAFLVKPGSRVDVVAVMSVKRDNKSETISKTILQNVEVAAVGQEIGERNDTDAVQSKSATLLVKPEDVPRLHLAAQRGKILLAMRNQVDQSSRRAAGTTEKRLLGEETDGEAQSADAHRKAGLLAKLFGQTQAQPVAVPAPTVVAMATPADERVGEWTVEVVNGSNVTEVRFDSPNSRQRAGQSGASTGRPSPVKQAVRPAVGASLGGGTDVQEVDSDSDEDLLSDESMEASE